MKTKKPNRLPKRKNNRMTLKYYVISSLLLLTQACQSTQNPSYSPVVKKTPSITATETITVIEVPDVKIKNMKTKELQALENTLQPPVNRFQSQQQTLNNPNSPLINKEVCRDDVDITYTVKNKNGTPNTYNAIVQAQGTVINVSQDNKNLKIKTTGWYSTNSNLTKWAPHLTKPPLAKDITLKINAEFWDKREKWYICGKKQTNYI